MERNPAGPGFLRMALIATVALCGASTRSSAGLIASDSYATGTDPTSGQYAAGISLFHPTPNPGMLGQPDTLTNAGFVTGGYNSGAGTSNFLASSTGLTSVADGATSTDSGSVAWIAATGPTVKSVARNLSTFTEGTTGTYWMSMLVKNTGASLTTDGWALGGFGGTVAPTLGTTSPGFLQGIYVGFANDSGIANEADLVLRYRDTSGNKSSADAILVNGANNATANQTYLVVAEVNVNYNGSLDQVNYWVNPTDLSSMSGLGNSTTIKGALDTYSFQGAASGNGDFARLNYAAYDYNGAAFFDEARLGTSLDSIAPLVAVPEPASLVLSSLGGGLFGLGMLRRRRSAR